MDDTSKYRQLLVRTLHSCCIRFPDVASNVIPLLMDFLSDSVNDESSAADVLIFTREAMAKFEELRPTIIEKLLEAFSTIKSARISRAGVYLVVSKSGNFLYFLMFLKFSKSCVTFS